MRCETLPAIVAQHTLSTPAMALLVVFAAIGAVWVVATVARQFVRPRAGRAPAVSRAMDGLAREAPGHGISAAGEGRRVVLAGYGLVGRAVAEQLDKIGVAYTIVEMNPRTVERQTKFNKDILHGNICDTAVLEDAAVRDAAAVIITIPDDQAALLACRTVREIAPDVFIAVRATFLSQATLATEAGADHVTVEEVSTAQAMAAVIAERLGKRAPQAPRPEALRATEPA